MVSGWLSCCMKTTEAQNKFSMAGVYFPLTMNVTSRSCTTEMLYGLQPHFKGLYVAGELIIAVLAIVGNFLVCMAVTCNKKLHTVTNYFLVSLAVADILVGLVAIPCAVLIDLGQPHHNLPLCLVLLGVLMMLMQTSILNLLAITGERYMAIHLPFQYQRVMSSRNAWLFLLVTWALGVFSGLVPLIDWQRQPVDFDYCIFTCVVDMSYMVYFNFFCCLLVPLVAMIIMYSHIFLTVRRQLRRIIVAGRITEDVRAAVHGSTWFGTEDSGISTPAEGEGSGSDVGIVKGREAKEKNETREAEVRAGEEAESGTGSPIRTETTIVFTKPDFRIIPACSDSSSATAAPAGSNQAKSSVLTCQGLRKAMSLFLVLLLFMVCWMPIHLINAVLLFCPHCKVHISLIHGAVLLSHANSALNPILYAYRMRPFQNTLAGIWRGMWTVGPQ